MTKFKSAVTLFSVLTLSGCASFDMGMLNPFSSDEEQPPETMELEAINEPVMMDSSNKVSEMEIEAMHDEWVELKPDIVQLFKLEAEVQSLKSQIANQQGLIQAQNKKIAQLESSSQHQVMMPSQGANKGNYSIQVAAAGSKIAAERAWRSQSQKFSQFFSSYRPDYSTVMSNGQQFYRVKVGSFTTRMQANKACDSLKSMGGQCVVRAN